MDSFGRINPEHQIAPLLNPDSYHRRPDNILTYEQYQDNYIDQATNRFYTSNKDEEWFHERFNPYFQSLEEDKISKASAVEAISFFEAVTAGDNDNKIGGDKVNIEEVCSLSEERYLNWEREIAHRSIASDQCLPYLPYGSGHFDRTIQIKYIPAICKRSEFCKYVTEALTKRAGIGIARILVSRPFMFERQYFERLAWIVLEDAFSMRESLHILQSLRIPIYGRTTVDTMEPPLLKEFPAPNNRIHVEKFFPYSCKILPTFASHPARVLFDLRMTKHIASLLDEIRNLPLNVRLNSLLSAVFRSDISGNDTAEKKQQQNMLDTAVTYLRRVHHLSYFDFVKCFDEAHLLKNYSHLWLRPRPLNQKRGEEVEADDSEGNKEVLTDEDMFHVSSEQWTEIKAKDSNDLGNWLSEQNLNLKLDDWVFNQVKMLELKLELSRKSSDDNNTSNGNKSSHDNADKSSSPSIKGKNDNGEEIDRIFELEFPPFLQRIKDDFDASQKIDRQRLIAEDDFIRRHTKLEPEGKARCSISWCNKLFKDDSFLKKHIINKHSDIMEPALSWVSDEFVRARFNRCSFSELPMPKIPVETRTGIIEMRPQDEVMRVIGYYERGDEMNRRKKEDRDRHQRDDGDVVGKGKRDRDGDESGERPVKRSNVFDPDAPKVSLIYMYNNCHINCYEYYLHDLVKI